MKLDDNHRITTFERNIVLEKLRKPVEKFKKINGVKVSQGMSKERWEYVGFYRTHRAAVDAWVDSELREAPQEVSVLLRKVDELHKKIAEVFND